MCLAFIGYEGSERHVGAQRKLVGRIVARHGGLCIGSGPGALYDQKKFDTPYIRDFLLDRGALADVSETAAPWSLLPAVYDNVIGAARGGVPVARRARLRHVPPVALVPLGRVPVLHVRDQAVRRARSARRVRRRSSRRSSRRSWTPAPRCRTTTPSAPSTREWLEQDISAPGRRDAAGAVRRRRPAAATSTRARSSDRPRVRGVRSVHGPRRSVTADHLRADRGSGAARAARAGERPSRSRSRRGRHDRARARPDAALRVADLVVVGDGERAARGAAAGCGLAGRRRVARGELRTDAGHAAPAPDCDCGMHGLHPTQRSARRVIASRGQIAGRGRGDRRDRAARGRVPGRARAAGRAPGSRPAATRTLVRRLAAAHDAQVVEVAGPTRLLAWCRARGLGLDAGRRRGAARRRRRSSARRAARAPEARERARGARRRRPASSRSASSRPTTRATGRSTAVPARSSRSASSRAARRARPSTRPAPRRARPGARRARRPTSASRAARLLSSCATVAAPLSTTSGPRLARAPPPARARPRPCRARAPPRRARGSAPRAVSRPFASASLT